VFEAEAYKRHEEIVILVTTRRFGEGKSDVPGESSDSDVNNRDFFFDFENGKNCKSQIACTDVGG